MPHPFAMRRVTRAARLFLMSAMLFAFAVVGVTPRVLAAPPTKIAPTLMPVAPAAERSADYVRLDALVVIFERVEHRDREDQPFTLTERHDTNPAELEKGVRRACAFYWRNSGCKLLIVPHFMRTGEAVQFTGWWLPNDIATAAVDKALAALPPAARPDGKSRVADFDTLWTMWQSPRYDPARVWREDEVEGGGGTVFRFSSWEAANSPTWMAVHEFHHQLDEFWKRSGFEDYPSNHPNGQPGEGFSAEHFDINAGILRAWPRALWPRFKFGRHLRTADRDGDGLPDFLPEAPFDEVRLRSSSFTADTDGDGLRDLDESMAGLYRGSDLRNRDTDGDGLRDGVDPYPLYAVEERVPYRAATNAASPAPPGTPLFRASTRDGFQARVWLWWNERGLHFAVRRNRAATTRLYFDMNADGRWRGAGNYEITVDAANQLQLRLWDARPGFYGFDTQSDYAGGARLVQPAALRLQPMLGGFILTVPANALSGPHLRDDQLLGMRLEFTGIDGRRESYATVFERWHFVIFKLARRRGPTSHLAPNFNGGFGRQAPPREPAAPPRAVASANTRARSFAAAS